MEKNDILKLISQGRTDLIFDLLAIDDWQAILNEGRVKPLQWLVYYNDVTALKAVLDRGGNLESIDLNAELLNASFFGHWKVCDFLIQHGADVNCTVPGTGETPLHGALSKAGRPYYLYTVRLLVECGADVNAKTIAGSETESFMRDVRNRGETPLHRAAAFADEAIIEFLISHGADREARDANGDSSISWASQHLRPGKILSLLSFGEHRVGEKAKSRMISDHGAGWGNGMEWNLVGDYLPLNNREPKTG